MIVLLGAFAGCDREAEARAEAKQLLERLQALSGDGTLVQRQKALDGLRAMELRSAEHREVRDVCAGAHQQLLQAEAAQVAARKALEDATKAQAGGTGIPPERGQAIAADLQRSNDALAASKAAFPKCETLTLKLTRVGR